MNLKCKHYFKWQGPCVGSLVATILPQGTLMLELYIALSALCKLTSSFDVPGALKVQVILHNSSEMLLLLLISVAYHPVLELLFQVWKRLICINLQILRHLVHFVTVYTFYSFKQTQYKLVF